MATGLVCFSERIRSTPIPPHLRIAQGVDKYQGDAKPQTWLDDYRIAVQIRGGGDEIAMMHLPLLLEGSARTWLNQLPPVASGFGKTLKEFSSRILKGLTRD